MYSGAMDSRAARWKMSARRRGSFIGGSLTCIAIAHRRVGHRRLGDGNGDAHVDHRFILLIERADECHVDT